jgi:hypothetical protein
MRFLTMVTALVLSCVAQVAQAAENSQAFEYLFIGSEERAKWAALTEQGLAVAGTKMIYFFNEKRSLEICKDCRKPYGSTSASRVPVGGYPLSVIQRPDGQFIMAGVDHSDRPWLFSSDPRFGYVALVRTLRGHNKNIETFEYGRVARKVIAAEGKQALVLFEADGSNMIMLMDSQSFARKKVKFGAGAHADIARHTNGDISVLGFEDEENGWQRPVYWRFSADLKQIEKRILTLPSKKRGNTDAVVKIAVTNDDVYILYGIPEGVKDARPDGMVFQSLQEGTVHYSMPYLRDVALLVTPQNVPMIALTEEGRPKTITYDTGAKKFATSIYPAPKNPEVCFMQKKRISFVDLLFDQKGFGYFVMGSKPLAHNEAGCIAVARGKF